MTRWLSSALALLVALPVAAEGPGAPEAAAPAPPPHRGEAARAEPARGELTVAVGGDVMFGRLTPDGYRAHGGARPFEPYTAALARADVAFANLETGICAQGRTTSPLPLLWAPAARLDALAAAGIDVVSVANNHALDCGPEGLDVTRAALAQRGVRAAGVGPGGAVRVTEDVVVLAATLHPVPYRAVGARPLFVRDTGRLVARVRALRRADPAALLLVSLHWGREGAPRPAASQRVLGRALIAAGANAVVGHGSHTVQPRERVGDGIVLYSLGNLVFDDHRVGGSAAPPVVLRFRRAAAGFVFLDLTELAVPRAR